MTFLERSLHRVQLNIYIVSIAKYTISYFVVLHLCSSMPLIKKIDIFPIKCSSWISYQYIFGNVHISSIYWLICMNTNYQLNFIFWNMEWIIFQKLKLHNSIKPTMKISKVDKIPFYMDYRIHNKVGRYLISKHQWCVRM